MKNYKIKKIELDGKYWVLYPKNGDCLIKLPVKIVYGNLPPVRKLPWQCHDLELKLLGRIVVYANMDGLVLFDIPKKEYRQYFLSNDIAVII
jgi:hypothetical protein